MAQRMTIASEERVGSQSPRTFAEGQAVYLQDLRPNVASQWTPAKIVCKLDDNLTTEQQPDSVGSVTPESIMRPQRNCQQPCRLIEEISQLNRLNILYTHIDCTH